MKFLGEESRFSKEFHFCLIQFMPNLFAIFSKPKQNILNRKQQTEKLRKMLFQWYTQIILAFFLMFVCRRNCGIKSFPCYREQRAFQFWIYIENFLCFYQLSGSMIEKLKILRGIMRLVPNVLSWAEVVLPPCTSLATGPWSHHHLHYLHTRSWAYLFKYWKSKPSPPGNPE